MLDRFFNPRSVAVIGASTRPQSLGHVLLKNIVEGGYEGDVYPINPRADTILGLRAYPSISDVEAVVDLAIVMTPSTVIIEVARQCGEKGVKALVVISAGFSESGNAELEEALIAEAERWGMRVIGPNCAGIINTSNKLYASIESRISPGKIAFVTQSGALGGAVLAWAENEGIGFSKFASYGNASDVDESDLISHLESDEATEVITLYVEGVKDGRKFYETTKRVASIKPVIVMKGGLSAAGSRAVQSHTGALAGNSAIYMAAFKQAGVTYADTIEDMFDMAKALIFQGRVSGGRVVVLTNSGGPAVMVVDELEELGFSVPAPSPEIKERLRFLPDFTSVRNPVDLTAQGSPENYAKVLEVLFSEDYYDAGIVVCVPPLGLDASEVAEAVAGAELMHKKPIIACFMAGKLVVEAIPLLERKGIPNFPTPKRTARALSVMLKKG
jgi:acetyl coenzyme A synthetase (ADP forming)-like protein